MCYLGNNENKVVFPLCFRVWSLRKCCLIQLDWDQNHKMPELEEISEDVWFNPISHSGDEVAEAQPGEMAAGLSSRACKKPVCCSSHDTSGSPTSFENGLEHLRIHRLRGLTAKVSASVTLGWGLGNCISDKRLDDSGTAGLGPHFENHEAKPCCLSWLPWKCFILFVGMVVIRTIPSTEEFRGNPFRLPPRSFYWKEGKETIWKAYATPGIVLGIYILFV